MEEKKSNCCQDVEVFERFNNEELNILFEITGKIAVQIGSKEHDQIMQIRQKIVRMHKDAKNRCQS